LGANQNRSRQEKIFSANLRQMNSILTDNQTKLLEKAGSNKFITGQFYLTGGTALAEIYLHHRFSEDLDFFSEKEFDILSIDVFLKNLKSELNFNKIDFQQSFNRNIFFLHFEKEILKVEFTFFPFTKIAKGEKLYNIEADSLIDIAVNKLFSIYQRSNARDYIDLYLICEREGFSVSELIKKTRIKFDFPIDPLQLGTQFVKALETKDFPRMIVDVKTESWQNFFINESKKLKNDILT
jgi:hypothetical protein